MSRKVIRKAQQITVDAMAPVAATGVARALEARQAAGIGLTSEELSHINGGNSLFLDLFILGLEFISAPNGPNGI
jgi:hypothetical protein